MRIMRSAAVVQDWQSKYLIVLVTVILAAGVSVFFFKPNKVLVLLSLVRAGALGVKRLRFGTRLLTSTQKVAHCHVYFDKYKIVTIW